MVEILTSTQVRKGQELFMTYADSTDLERSSTDRARFYAQFGFVDDTLPIILRIQLHLLEGAPHFREKAALFPKGVVDGALFQKRQKKYMLEYYGEGSVEKSKELRE